MFREYTKTEHHLVSIKTTKDGIGSLEDLLVALEWCANNSVDLIHMSLGTRQFDDFDSISKAVKNLDDTVIVAACSNQNTLTFPACLPNVIGVRHCNLPDLMDTFVYVPNPYDNIEFFTYIENRSNSTAAPVITAQVCNYLANEVSGLDNIRWHLQEIAAKDISFLNYDFYKSLLPEWTDVKATIAIIPNHIPKSLEKLKNLVTVFIENGYRAIGLTHNNTSVEEFVFRLEVDDWQWGQASIADMIKLYYNFALPDILFIHTDLERVFDLPEELRPDVVVGSLGESYYPWHRNEIVLDILQDDSEIFSQIAED